MLTELVAVQYKLDMGQQLTMLEQWFELFLGVLRLDETSFLMLVDLQQAPMIMLILLLCVGLSSAVGQSAVLFINRVRPNQFIWVLVSLGMYVIAGLVVWYLSTYAIVRLIWQQELAWQLMLQTLILACAPLLFSFFVALPVLGIIFELGLALWCLLAVMLGLTVVTNLNSWQAFLSAIIGWLLYRLLYGLFGRPMLIIIRDLRARLFGVMWTLDPQELEQRIKEGEASLREVLTEYRG